LSHDCNRKIRFVTPDFSEKSIVPVRQDSAGFSLRYAEASIGLERFSSSTLCLRGAERL
jgi:hypothetical protein